MLTAPLDTKGIIEAALVMSAAVTLAAGCLIAGTAIRQRQRERLFRRLDGLRKHYAPIVAKVLAGELDTMRGVSILQQIRGPDRAYVLEKLCLDRIPPPAQAHLLQHLCEELGLVRMWQHQLVGNQDWERLIDAIRRPHGLLDHIAELQFLVRVRGAENLRLVRHRPSWPLLVRALDDRHRDVQKAAARALGTLAEPESFGALVRRLHAIVLDPGATKLSLRTLKAAMATFSLPQAADLLPLLNHPHPQLRFLAADIVREMVELRGARDQHLVLTNALFPVALSEAFLFRLPFDESPEVRARAAPVIAWMPENAPGGGPQGPEAPIEVLLRLLDDPQWFVRLHAVRALGKPRHSRVAPEVARRLTDPHWRVREAAAQALLALGQNGLNQLFDHLVATRDRFTQDQIAEELERSGMVGTLLERYADGADRRERRILETLVNLGKTYYLERALLNGVSADVRRRFWMDYEGHPDRRVHAWAKRVTGN